MDNIRNDFNVLGSKENCQGRKRNTELIGGVSYDASTPHKSGKGCGSEEENIPNRTFTCRRTGWFHRRTNQPT